MTETITGSCFGDLAARCVYEASALLLYPCFAQWWSRRLRKAAISHEIRRTLRYRRSLYSPEFISILLAIAKPPEPVAFPIGVEPDPLEHGSSEAVFVRERLH